MILVRQRRSEERHDAVAHYLVDRAFVAMHRVHHVLEHRVDDDFASSGSRSASNFQ